MVKFKIPNFMVDFGLSRYQRRKIKKAIKIKENELRGVEYTLCSGYKTIDLQIIEMREDGFNEDSVRAVLSKKLNILTEHRNTLKIEVENLERYLFDDECGKELNRLEKEEIGGL